MQVRRKNSSSLIDKLVKWTGFVLLITSTSLPTIETTPVCYGKVDIVFTVDASYSIVDQNFDKVREFLLNLCAKMQVDLGEELRAGLIFYATSPYTGENMVSLNDDQSKIAKLLQTFQRVKSNIKTFTGEALGVAHDMFANHARDDAYKILILITDGEANDRAVAYANADRIKALGVHILAIGIGFDGEKVNRAELNYIASRVESVYIVTSITADFMMSVQMDVCGQTLASKAPPTVVKDDVKMDLYFLLDEAMLAEDFEITKRFMKNVLQTFELGPEKASVSVYLYGSSIGQYFTVGTYSTEASLFSAIDNLALNPSNQNGRNIVGMFSTLQTQITNSGTTGPVIVMLFVTGSVDSSAEAIYAAKTFRDGSNPNVYLITMGIGTNTAILTSEQNRLAYDTGTAFQAANFLSLAGNDQASQDFVNSVRSTIFQLAKGTYVKQGAGMSYRWTSMFDVVFMIDGSAKMSQFIYYPVVKFVIKHLIDQFELGPDAGRVAVLVYDAVGVYNIIRFDTYNHNHDTLFDKIDNLQLIQREDSVDNAVGLAGMLKYFMDNKREPAGSKLGYLITLGQARNKIQAEAEARALAMEGIQLLTIGISPGVSESELNSYQMFEKVDGPTIITRIESLASSRTLQELDADLLKYAQISRPRGLIYQWGDAFDLVVLVHDESGRIDGGAGARNFLIDLFHRYEIANDKVQGGVISFGLTTQDQIILGTDPFYTALYLKLLNLDLTPTGGADVLAGLDALLNMFETNGRPSVPKVALLLMQGDVVLDSVRAKIQEIRDKDIAIVTVGIGAGTDMVDLQYIANHKELAFLQTNWQSLRVTPTMDASIIALARGSFKAQGTGDILRLPTQCTGEGVGIIFVLDASNSFQTIFEAVKRFAAALMSGFSAPVEIGAIAYANIVLSNYITPGDYMSFVELYAHFMANVNLDPTLMTTSTHLALEKMREMFSQKNPPYKEKVGIVITDGKSSSAIDTTAEAERARNDGIKMIAISFLDDTFENELGSITGEEITGGVNHKFLYSNSDLTNPSKLEAIQKLICALIRPNECLAGSYRDPITLECLKCPVGSFQALSEQLFCQQCALGYSTTDPGATRSSDCIKKCNAGYFLESAPNGKCKICPKNTYQPDSGQIQCLTCSPSLITKFEGSTSIDDCILDKCDVPMDLILVVDSTASIGVFEFQMLKAFLINQLDRFDFVTTRISVVRIGAITKPEDVTDFLTDKNLVIEAIRNLKGGDYSTNIASAIEMANNKFESDFRDNVPQVMFLITDGIASNPYAARYQALVAQQKRQLVVLGIGTQYFMHELRELASVPDTVMTEANFIKLASLDAYLTICDAAKRWAKPPVVSTSKCDLALDIIFVMDTSASFSITEIIAMKAVLTTFTGNLQISATKVNVGILSFHVDVQVDKKLPLSSDLDAINTAIMMQTSTGLGTATDLALLEAKNMLEASTRPDAARAILIITDGQSNNPAQTAVAADILEKAGIYVVAIGLGSGAVFEKELDTISTSGSDTTILVTTLASVSTTVLNTKVCPENFKCSYTLQVVYVWDFSDSAQVLANTKKLAADVSVRFADVQAKIIEVKTNDNTQDIDTLLKGMTEARKETTALKVYDTIHNIVLITDKPSADIGTDSESLLTITTALKKEGVKITIINARDEDDEGWEKYATSKETVFHGSDFHEIVPAWKFHRSLCKEPCDSGYNIGTDGKCEECPIGTYRDKTKSYMCTACSTDSTTLRTGSTSRADCTIKIQCEKPMDLVFLIDATASIGNNYNLLKAYFWSLVDKFPVGLGDDQTRIAVGKIGEDVDEDADFSLLSESVNSFAVKASIIGLLGNEQSTNTAVSLEMVYNIFKTEGRDNTKYPHIVLVATDGRSGNTFQTKRYSSILKLNGIRTLVIALGDGVFQPEIEALAYDSNSIFSFSTYKSLVESTYIPEKICDAAESYKPSTPVITGPELLGECKSYMDMVFVVDASLSVTYPVFLQMKIFMIQFAQMLDIGQNRIRIGVIAFSSTVHSQVFSLNQCTDQKTLETDGILPQVWTSGGTTNTAAALDRMIQMFVAEGRQGIPYVAIVMTDGKSDVPASTKLQAQRAKEKGIHIVALGFGTISLGTNAQELYDIATDPASVKAVSTFSEITPKQLLDLSCSFNFECSNNMDIIAVWDLVNFDTIRRAEIFIDGLKKSFVNSVVTNIFVDHVADVALAMKEAVQKQQSSSKTNFNVARVIMVITDNLIDANVKARLEVEINVAKADGILVAVVDAATTSNNIENFASNDKLSFFTNRYDMLPFELVIKRSLCTVPCTDGYQVSSTTGSCEECEVNKYRDSDESFLCQSCPDGRTTDGATASDRLSDCLLGNCLAPMDIVFVVDSSQSIRTNEYTLMKVFLLNLIGKFDISEDRTRVGILPYTSDVLSGDVFPLQQSTEPEPVLQAVRQLNQGTLPTGTNTARAIDVAVDMFKVQGRRTGGVMRILVLLTDGMSTNTYKTIEEANKAKAEFIRLFVIGVGPNVFQYELDRVASDEDSKLMVPNFLTLATNTDFITRICEDTFTCTKSIDIIIFEDRITTDPEFKGRFNNFVVKLASSFSQSTVAISPYTNMVELSTQADNQDLSTNPQKTKLFIFVTKTDILDVDVKNKIVSKLRNTGGIVSVINARTDLDNINFVTIVNSLQFLFNVENFNELPAYRFLERKFCIDPCDDGEQRRIDGSCEKCPRGTYRVKTDAHTCVQCTDGKTTENTGSTADTACIPNCGPGFKTVGENCVECGKGEYQADSFQSNCDTCKAGYSTKETKSTSVDQCIRDCNEGERISPTDKDTCIACEANTYQPERVQTECIDCPINLFSLAGSDSLDDCNDACGKNMDIIFLVDASMSLTSISFKLVKVFLENSVYRFKVGLTATRIGIIQFADNVPTNPRLDLTGSTDRVTVTTLVRSLVQSTKPGTNTAAAIDAAVTMFDNQGRAGIPKNIIVITDGMSDNTALTVAAAARAKRRFINIISIGVGSNFFLDELLRIATDETALKTFTSFYSLVTFNILPTVCTPTQFSCDKNMDIFYIKNYDSNADVETKVTKFISDFETRYLSGTTLTLVDAVINVESLVDDLNHFSDTTNPANTKVLIIFTNKANVAGSNIANVVKDQGVIVAVVYSSDITTDTSYDAIVSNEDLLFYAENFDQSPYNDFILRSLCIAPCGDGSERAGTGYCEQCAKGSYRTAVGSHVCQDCPSTTEPMTTAGPGATDVSQCVACSADEVPCATGTSITGDTCIPITDRCNGVNNCFDGSDEICNTCTIGYKWTGSICKQCEKGTFQDKEKQTDCIKCPEGSTTDGTGKSSVSACYVICNSNGQELDYPDGNCRDCQIGYYRNKDEDSVCVKCENGFITKQVRSTSKDDCVSPCEAGQGWDDVTKACVDCSLGSYQPEPNKITCLSCPAGKTTVSVKSTLASDCQDPCQPGEELPVGGTESADCQECPLNTYKSSQDIICQSCPPVHITLATGSTASDSCIPNCDVGYYYDESLEKCQKCTFGTYQDQKYQTSCKSCETGKTTTTQGNDEESDCIVPCPAGSYLPFRISGQCTPCPQGTYRVNDETIATCTPCESGKNTDGEGSTSEADCKPDCKPGEKIVGNVCEKCEIGTYQTKPREISCDTCGDYKSTEQTGADSADKCVDTCPSGTQLTQKNPLVCEKCPMNNYKEAGVDEKCTPCPANHITLADGAANIRECVPNCENGKRFDSTTQQCVDCDIGTFQPEFYKDFCYDCREKWTTVTVGAKTEDDCLPDCAAGEYWNENTLSCEKCPKDSYQPDLYKSSCQKCTNGEFTDDIGAINELQCEDQCPLGQEMGPGGTTPAECIPCKIGTFKDATTSTCQSCSDGLTTLDTGKTSSSDCKPPCATGERFDTTLKVCVKCEVGTYQDEPNSDTCKPCTPSGYTTLQPGSKLDTDCLPPCKPGSAWDNGVAACKQCWKGKYQDEANQVECKTCPGTQTTLGDGADSLDDCIDPTCGAQEWQCDDGQCIDEALRCDGTVDCTDNSDESNTNCCPIGQFFDYSTNQCEACPAGSYQDIPGETSCMNCPKGQISAAGSDEPADCQECPAGSQLVDGATECTECPEDMYRRTGMMTCSFCPPNFVSDAGSTDITDCKPDCEEGEYYDTGLLGCEPCPIGYYQDQEKQGQCNRCTTGTTTEQTGSTSSNQCIDICDPGYTLVYDSEGKPTTSCNPCPVSTYKDNSDFYECKPCAAGFTTAATGSTECLPDCDAGNFYPSKTSPDCKLCSRGSFQPDRLQSSCIQCPAGQTTPIIGATTKFLCYNKCSAGYKYDSTTDLCEICPKGTYRRKEDEGDCKVCRTGFTTEGPGTPSEDLCVPNCVVGQYYNRQTSRCEPCPINSYQSEPYKYVCVQCPTGTAVSSTGSDEMSDCEDPCTVAGEELQPDGSCGPCKVGFAKIPPSTICTECPGGFTTEGTGGSECVPDCTEGNYWDGTKCSPCVKGEYQPNKYKYDCVDCPTGRTTANVGASQSSQCIDICPNGFELQVDGTCKPCDKNYYRTNGVQLQCTPCQKNFITLFEGAETADDCRPLCDVGTEWNDVTGQCEPCKIGFYQDEEYQKQCKACDSGKTTENTGQISEDSCVGECEPGTYWNEATSQCTDCAKGTYQSEPNKDSCVQCLPGYTTNFPKSTSQQNCIDPCTSGYTYNAVLDRCDKCGYQKHRDRTKHNICQDCPPGLYTTTDTATSEAECISYCTAGNYWSKDKRVCIKCEIGFYQPNQSALQCIPCSDGWITLFTESTLASQCRPPCVEGEEWDDTSKTCVPCPTGEYQNTKYEENCKICDVGKSTQSIRSTKESDCQATSCLPGQWKCLTGTGCVDWEGRCDNAVTCADGSDEAGCNCVPGTYYDTASDTCKNCETGSYQDKSGQLTCIQCPVGSDSPTNSDSLSDCEDVCESGEKYVPGNLPADRCVQCPVGTYRKKGRDDPLVCIECPTPFTTENPGADDIGSCVPKCPKGQYYRVLPNEGCVICSLGYTQDKEYNQYSCEKCPPGTTTLISDLNSCTDICGLGEYLPLGGTVVADCKACEPGYYKDASVYLCKKCPNGFTSPSGSDSVNDCYEMCEAGETFIDTTLNIGCRQCDRGYYRETPPTNVDKTCSPCPAGRSTQLSGAISPTLCLDLCNDGLELSADKDSCVECPVGKYRAQGSGDVACVSCPVGTTTSTAGSATLAECKRDCGLGHRYDSGTGMCVECEVGTYQDERLQTTCVACPSWKTTLGTGSTSFDNCIDPCVDGYESVNDACVECERGTYRQQNVQPSCQDCRAQFTTLAPRQDTVDKCVPLCGQGEHWDEDSDSCVPCEPGKYNPVEYQLECLTCPADRPISSDDFTSCQADCPPGEQWNEERQLCNWCQPGTFSTGGYTNCQNCPPGTYSYIMGATSCITVNCGPGFVRPTAASSCIQCTGNQIANPTQNECIDCPPGLEPSDSHNSCVSPGTNWCPGGYQQTIGCDRLCPAGSFRPTGSQQNCQLCPLNTFQPYEGQQYCIPCSSTHTTQFPGRTSPSDCRSDWCDGGYEPKGNPCSPCPAGKYKPEGNTGDCQECELNFFQDLTGQTSCKSCSNGETTQNKGSTSQDQCQSDWCQGGHQPKPGSTDECEPCPLGKYKPSGQSGQCLECEKNFYQDETGAEGCKSCPKKRPHTMFKGSISVTLCSAEWCDPGMSYDKGKKDCFKCGIGKYRSLDDTGCQDCPSGATYTLTAKSRSECRDPCPKGSFIDLENKSCEQCRKDTFSDEENSLSCTPCEDNKKTKGKGSTSDMCNENWCPGGYTFDDIEESCVPCGYGKYRRYKLDPECIDCGDGRSTLINTASSPDDCIDNGARSCINGYVYRDGRCRPCPIGTYSSQNSSDCTPCPDSFTTRRSGSYHENLCITMHSECESQFDLIIAVDLSNSLTHDASHHVNKHLKYWLKCLVRRLDIHPYRVRVSVIKYARGVSTLINLHDSYTTENVCRVIDSGLKPSIRITVNTAGALRKAYDLFKQQGRPGVQKHILLIMDDRSSNPAHAAQIANYLKDRQVHITVIGPDLAEASLLASSRFSQFIIPSYLRLPLDYNVLRAVCRPRK